MMKIGVDKLWRFIGRKNTFSKQTPNGGYIPIRRTITEADLEKHLAGGHTLGSYVVREDGKLNFACVDVDTEPGADLEPYKKLALIIYDLVEDFERVLEFSGRRGYHIWVFPKEPEEPRFLRELLKSRLKKFGMRNIEIYPKQDKVNELEKKLGNLLKIPCGKHLKGVWSEILKWEDAK